MKVKVIVGEIILNLEGDKELWGLDSDASFDDFKKVLLQDDNIIDEITEELWMPGTVDLVEIKEDENTGDNNETE